MRMKSLQFTFLLGVLCLSGFVESADLIKFKGENATMKCHISEEQVMGVSLYTRHEDELQVVYYHMMSDKLTIKSSYEGRVKAKFEGKTLTVDILNLQMKDAGAYWCKCSLLLTRVCKMDQSGVLLMVRDRKTEQVAASTAASKPGGIYSFLVPVVAVTASSVIVLLFLVLGVWIVPKIKEMRITAEQGKRSINEVYEVMTVKREYR
ncbi:uncharacterized protein LOC130221358 [Danio aesculapii]|uniref:uncharacterized protein LOC130221358 n=1 Tax=Danio aesculapii TaxID=1142201 RepID=UPI0024C09EDB|nr:uncharacterized protein LOC130221358 [Danio aesculapii]